MSGTRRPYWALLPTLKVLRIGGWVGATKFFIKQILINN